LGNQLFCQPREILYGWRLFEWIEKGTLALNTKNSHPGTRTCLDCEEVEGQGTDKADVGVVYKKNIGSALVRANGRVVLCSLSNRLRKQLVYAQSDGGTGHRSVRQVKELAHNDPIAVGDQVRFIATDDGAGMIVEVLPRRSQMTRRSAVPMPGAHPIEQVIVANLDQVVPVFAAAQPAPKWGLLDRYLVSAEASGLPALICITKLDLVSRSTGENDADLLDAVKTYRRIGYTVVLTSAVTGEGLDELHAALNGRISALLGKSGVGKTSLLNALQPGLGLRVNQVNERTGKGKHTTTALEMFPLDGGKETEPGTIVDTPGIREFGLWDVDGYDLAQFFPEMRPLVGRCRFGLDCRHDEEPGCAIRIAVTKGQVSPYRYRSLRVLTEETT
jgi:ribosome biogenesis GTPase